MAIDKDSAAFALKNGLDGFFNPLAKLGESLLPTLATIIKGARGDDLKESQRLDLAGMPSAGDYFKNKKSISEEFRELQDTVDAPTGFLGRTRKPQQVRLQQANFTMNKRLAQRVQQLAVKNTFQDPNVGKYLRGVGLTMGIPKPNIKGGSPNPTQSLKEIV